jgi:hypothetical protein
MLRADGKTMPDTAQRLGVSKSSVSLWTRDVEFEPRPRLRARRRGPNALQRRKQAEIDRLMAEGVTRIDRLSKRELLVAGAALYAGEGGNGDGNVQMANTNPLIIGFFCTWLRRFYDTTSPDFGSGSACIRDLTSRRQSITGPRSPACLRCSSERRIGPSPIPPYEGPSTSTGEPPSATVAPERIEASWAW